jgi:hypothetical protein
MARQSYYSQGGMRSNRQRVPAAMRHSGSNPTGGASLAPRANPTMNGPDTGRYAQSIDGRATRGVWAMRRFKLVLRDLAGWTICGLGLIAVLLAVRAIHSSQAHVGRAQGVKVGSSYYTW